MKCAFVHNLLCPALWLAWAFFNSPIKCERLFLKVVELPNNRAVLFQTSCHPADYKQH